MARPAKLTPEIHTAIVKAVAIGVPLTSASELAGLDGSTAREWVQRGLGLHPTRSATPQYVAFAADVVRARAQDEARRVAQIASAGRGGAVIWRKTTTYSDGREVTEERVTPPDWQADAWHLERRYRQHYGKQPPEDVQAPEQPKIITQAEEAITDAFVTEVAHLLAQHGQLLLSQTAGEPDPGAASQQVHSAPADDETSRVLDAPTN